MIRIAWLLMLLPVPALAQSAVAKADLRSQSAAASERQLKDQLWSIFRPIDVRQRPGKPAPQRPLDSVWLTTKSYAVEYPGLCRIDAVTLSFAPVRATTPGNASTPTRAYGLNARSYYRFQSPPQDWDDSAAGAGRMPWDKECAGLDMDKQQFFGAPDDSVAVSGYYAMLIAKREIAQGTGKSECDNGDRYETRSCMQRVAAFAAGGVSDVARCEAVRYGHCFAITDTDDVEMRVVLTGGHVLETVKLVQQLILVHERID